MPYKARITCVSHYNIELLIIFMLMQINKENYD